MYEYTTAVYAVGLEGFAEVDNARITAMAADGWEPTQMAPIHNGFAAVVLFRRDLSLGPATTRPATTRTRKTPPKAATARSARAPAPKATTRAAAKVTSARGSAAKGAPARGSAAARGTRAR